MKELSKIVTLALLLCIGSTAVKAQTCNQCATHKNNVTMNKNNQTVQGILNAIELYAEAGRKASRELGEKAFTKEATMSWVEKGVITTVPINALFDVLEQTGEEEVTYTVEDVTVAGNVAFVRISSSFSKLTTFNDMFTLESRLPAGFVRSACRKPTRCCARQAFPLPTSPIASASRIPPISAVSSNSNTVMPRRSRNHETRFPSRCHNARRHCLLVVFP